MAIAYALHISPAEARRVTVSEVDALGRLLDRGRKRR